MKKIFLYFVFILFACNGLFAQNVQFTATAPNVVTVGEQFRLVFTINAECTGFKGGELKGFNVLAGPFTSTSSSFQMINGRTSQSVSNSFTYLLEPTKEGKYTIGGATAMVNGKKVQSNSLAIEVVKGSGGTSNNANQNANSKTDNSGTVTANGELFARVNLNKTSVYQGEAIVATIKVYTRMRLVGFNDMKFPSFNGFFSQDIQTPTQISLQRENLNGKVYEVGLMKQTILFPQRSGELTIDPFELECVVQEKVGQSRNIFGQIFDDYDNVKKKVRSASTKIVVKPLPANKPADFSGTVGTDFKMTATIDKQKIKTNDGVTIKVSIVGSGNLKLIDAIKVDIPTTFEKYDPKVENNIRNTAAGSVGTKDVEYFFIPRSAGDFRIAPITFSYFDLNTNQYKTLTSQEFNIHVDKGSENETAVSSSATLKEDVETLGSDIRFINQRNFQLNKTGDIFFGSGMFYLSYLAALLLFGIIVILLRKQIKENANVALVKNKRANKVSRLRLKLAAKYLSENKKEAFYEEILKTLWGYFSDKLAIPVSQLSRDNISETLEKYSVEKEVSTKFIQVLDTCEFARYAPSMESSEMNSVYEDAASIISTLEHKLK